MPVVSKAQMGAMEAAKHGHSTLGIPQKVGSEFVAATKHVKDLPEHVKKESDAINCADSVHGYLDAVVRGDSAGMAHHSDKFHRG